MIGCSARRSLTRKAAKRATLAAKTVTVTGLPHPEVAARTKPYTRATIPSVEVAAPVRSKRPGRGRSREDPGRQGDQDDADRHVDEEAPPPGDPGGQHSPHHQSDAAPAPGHRAVGPDRPSPLRSLGEAHLEEGEGGRCGDGRPDALDGPGGQQPGGRLGQSAEEGRQGEQRDPGHEDPASSEDVAGAGSEQEQSAEGQGVGVLDPRQAGGREVQGAVDVRQGGDHDGGIQDDHQVGGQDDAQDDRGSAGSAGRGGGFGDAWGQGGGHGGDSDPRGG